MRFLSKNPRPLELVLKLWSGLPHTLKVGIKSHLLKTASPTQQKVLVGVPPRKHPWASSFSNTRLRPSQLFRALPGSHVCRRHSDLLQCKLLSKYGTTPECHLANLAEWFNNNDLTLNMTLNDLKSNFVLFGDDRRLQTKLQSPMNVILKKWKCANFEKRYSKVAHSSKNCSESEKLLKIVKVSKTELPRRICLGLDFSLAETFFFRLSFTLSANKVRIHNPNSTPRLPSHPTSARAQVERHNSSHWANRRPASSMG